MSEIENILLRDLYKDLPEVPVVERQGLGAMTGRGTVTTQQDTQQRDISPAQSSVAEYMKKIIQKQIQDGASISAAAQDVPFDPAIDNMETLSARGYDSDDVLRSSVATGAVSATKQKNVRRDVMEQAERMIQEMQQERTPVRKQEIQDYLTGVDIDKAQGNLEDSVLETISGILGVPVPPKDTTTEDDSITIEDAPDADVVLDEPVEITEESLMADPRAKRPKARPEDLEPVDEESGVSNTPLIPSNIDMSFLGEKEGFKLNAYVPEDEKGKAIDQSGVTVGTGVDLGSKNEEYFEGLEPSILNKLKPHFGKKKEAAQKSLKENSFSLTEEEALTLDNFVKAKEFNMLKDRWNKDSEIEWDDLPSNQATAIASVYYQHGNQTFGYNFWDQTTSGDWESAYDNLMTWGGSTPSRRRDEANLLMASN